LPEKAVLPQTHLIRYAPKTQDTLPAESHGNIFNCSKTVCMTFKAKSAKSTVSPLLTNGW